MGYSTDFFGSFKLNKKLDEDTLAFLTKFNATRRMKRNVHAIYGVDGEFYVNGKGDHGQDKDETVVNYNMPPSTQPGLWCQWKPNETGTEIEWDGGEKFYNYVEWIKYLVTAILVPRGYLLYGTVEWRGEDPGDCGQIVIQGDQVKVLTGKMVFQEE